MGNYELFKVVYDKHGVLQGVEVTGQASEKSVNHSKSLGITLQEIGIGLDASLQDVLGIRIDKIRLINNPGSSICCVTINDIDIYYWC